MAYGELILLSVGLLTILGGIFCLLPKKKEKNEKRQSINLPNFTATQQIAEHDGSSILALDSKSKQVAIIDHKGHCIFPYKAITSVALFHGDEPVNPTFDNLTDTPSSAFIPQITLHITMHGVKPPFYKMQFLLMGCTKGSPRYNAAMKNARNWYNFFQLITSTNAPKLSPASTFDPSHTAAPDFAGLLTPDNMEGDPIFAFPDMPNIEMPAPPAGSPTPVEPDAAHDPFANDPFPKELSQAILSGDLSSLPKKGALTSEEESALRKRLLHDTEQKR